jgi:hypothetical protein
MMIAFPPLFRYCFPMKAHECTPSCRSRRDHDHAVRKAISCQFLPKLHLGCGDNYARGYTNIDYPLSEDSLFKRKWRPDIEGDFTKIEYPADFFEEIMLHHVFEHFQRQDALALACKWNKMLKMGGILILSVPDVEACMAEYLNANEYRRRGLIRHMWGSHEAEWATHHEGWYDKSISDALTACGFETINITKSGGQWPALMITTKKTTSPNVEKIVQFLKPYDFNTGLTKYWMAQILNCEMG